MKTLFFCLALLALAPMARAQNHSVSLTVTANQVSGVGCSTATPCSAIIWRASGACKVGIAPSDLGASFAQITTTVLNGVTSTTGETFIYTDADQALLTNQTYCWTATVLYQSGGGQSAPAPTGFQLTIAPQSPSAPLITGSQKS